MKLDKLPETIDPSLNLEQVRQECRRLVKKRSFISAGVATVPVPFFDVVVDAGLLSQLLPYINEQFGLAPERMAAFDLKTRGRLEKAGCDRARTDFRGFGCGFDPAAQQVDHGR